MYLITAKVGNVKTTEGHYKNNLIAKRHQRRLEKRYPNTTFKVDRISKKDKAQTGG